MIDPVLSVCRIRSCLRCKESLLKSDAITCKADELKGPDGKLKASSDCSSKGKAQNAKNVIPDIEGREEDLELDDDLRFILENDSNKVEELMKSHTSEISETLHHMEQNLEELLNIVMTTCRAMTVVEKQQLNKLIHNLPPRNLDRVAEIIQLNKPLGLNTSNKLCIDLDELVEITKHYIFCLLKKNNCIFFEAYLDLSPSFFRTMSLYGDCISALLPSKLLAVNEDRLKRRSLSYYSSQVSVP